MGKQDSFQQSQSQQTEGGGKSKPVVILYCSSFCFVSMIFDCTYYVGDNKVRPGGRRGKKSSRHSTYYADGF